jgi:hypothetical protein
MDDADQYPTGRLALGRGFTRGAPGIEGDVGQGLDAQAEFPVNPAFASPDALAHVIPAAIVARPVFATKGQNC